MPPTTQPSKQPPNAETIVISFLCGSLALSFLLAALAAVLKVYSRPKIVAFIKRILAKMRRTPVPDPAQEELPEVQQREVQLVDEPLDFGLREDVGSAIAYPPPVVARN